MRTQVSFPEEEGQTDHPGRMSDYLRSRQNEPASGFTSQIPVEREPRLQTPPKKAQKGLGWAAPRSSRAHITWECSGPPSPANRLLLSGPRASTRMGALASPWGASSGKALWVPTALQPHLGKAILSPPPTPRLWVSRVDRHLEIRRSHCSVSDGARGRSHLPASSPAGADRCIPRRPAEPGPTRSRRPGVRGGQWKSGVLEPRGGPEKRGALTMLVTTTRAHMRPACPSTPPTGRPGTRWPGGLSSPSQDLAETWGLGLRHLTAQSASPCHTPPVMPPSGLARRGLAFLPSLLRPPWSPLASPGLGRCRAGLNLWGRGWFPSPVAASPGPCRKTQPAGNRREGRDGIADPPVRETPKFDFFSWAGFGGRGWFLG